MIPPRGSSGPANAPPPPSLTGGPPEHDPARYGFLYDASYASVTEQSSALHLETLEARLTTAQAHLAKESIRTAYLSLGEHHRRRGELRDAMRRLLRARDFCVSVRQTGQVCLAVVVLGIDSRDHSRVRDYVAKAEHTSDLLHADPLFASKLRVASAVVLLAEGRYEDAARKLADCSPDLTHQFNAVVSAEDIATYGAVLGLATLGREELRSLILDGPQFKSRLELVPPLRDALRHYVRSEFGPCLSLLSALRQDLMLDLHLRPHVSALYGLIRDRCVVQYFAPYAKVSLSNMGRAFGMTPGAMELVVTGLVKSGAIRDARVDSLNGTLNSHSGAALEKRGRRRTRARVARLGQSFASEAEGMVLRLSCLENDLVVQTDARGGGWGGGGGKAGGRAGRDRLRGGGHRGDAYEDGVGGGGGGVLCGMDSSDEDSLLGEGEAMDVDVAGMAA